MQQSLRTDLQGGLEKRCYSVRLVIIEDTAEALYEYDAFHPHYDLIRIDGNKGQKSSDWSKVTHVVSGRDMTFGCQLGS